jgi:glutathione S-transferase
VATYRLHCRSRSGNAYKVAFYLAASGLDWEPVLVTPAEGQSPEWRAKVNAMGEVPVLETGGRYLSQSGAILMELARTTGHFAPRNDAEWSEALRWILWDNHKFTNHSAAYRFARSFAPAAPSPDVLAYLQALSNLNFGVLDKVLAGRPYVLGDTPTIADFSLAGYIYYPASEWGYDWRPAHPGVAAWADRLATLPGWRPPYDLMPGGVAVPLR